MEVELTKTNAREFANSVGFRYVEGEIRAWHEDIRDQLEGQEHDDKTLRVLQGNAETVRNMLVLLGDIKDLAE
jgi:hypothetical protein